ncbi:MAG: hypothetical protein BroJett025_08610 [Patescibacteria group bacterium]|nr:MAG: hypothetical protein BroJett025_08610 [Patescibacteria group bacterium]
MPKLDSPQPYHEEPQSPDDLAKLALPLNGELPNQYTAIRFWDHLIEQHLDISKTWQYHSNQEDIDALIAEHTYEDKSSKQFSVAAVTGVLTAIAEGLQPEQIITRIEGNSTATFKFNGQTWIFHLTVEPSIYISTTRDSLKGTMRKGFTSINPSDALKKFYADSAQIFLNNSPFPADYSDGEDPYKDYQDSDYGYDTEDDFGWDQ